MIGPNGAGKTTFMDIVTGKTRPDEGEVIWGEEKPLAPADVGGRDCAAGDRPEIPAPDGVRGPVGARQPDGVAEERPGRDCGALYRVSLADAERIDELAEEIGLKDHLDTQAGILSHGQKQWLEIGMLLAQEPRLLLVDEPAAGMTNAERDHTTELLKEAAKTRAVVVVEHDMDFVRKLECKVTVLMRGLFWPKARWTM